MTDYERAEAQTARANVYYELQKATYRALTLVARDSLGPDATEEEVAELTLKLHDRGAADLLVHPTMRPSEEIARQIANGAR